MMLGKKAFFGAEIQKLGQIAGAGDVVEEAQGSERDIDVVDKYVDRLIQDYDGGERKLRVVWDSANGAAGEVLERLLKKLPGEHTVLNPIIDGNFPAHHPDPTIAKNQEQLIAAVRKHEADIGIGFDGDADRVGAVDDEGTMLLGDQLMVVLARDVLREHPGATIIADVKASQVLYDEIEKARWQAADVQDRAQPDQGQDGRDRGAVRRRDERPHLLCRQVVRLRRRAVCRHPPHGHRLPHGRQALRRDPILAACR